MLPHEYKPHWKTDPPLDRARCRYAVYEERGHRHQCFRKPWKDTWCKQHHPDTVKAREQASERRWKAKFKAEATYRVLSGLGEATTKQLEAELARRGSR